MENILLAIDAANLHMPTVDLACYLSSLSRSKVTGIFLENVLGDEKKVLQIVGGSNYLDSIDDEGFPEIDKKLKTNQNVSLFKKVCKRKSVRYTIEREEGVPGFEMITESRYADIIVTDTATSFKSTLEGTPTAFLKNLLKDTECPVVVAPPVFEGIDRIIFTYDGTRSSAFAMKQFTYLFPQFEDKSVTVFHVNDGATWTEDEKRKLTGWLQNHYSAIGFETVEGNASEELLSYLHSKRNAFVVMGAYGRSELSMLLKRSHADILLKTINHPIFIAHC